MTAVPFLNVCSLNENGEFTLKVPFSPTERKVSLEVSKLNTYLPLPEQNKENVCNAKEKPSRSLDVKKLEVDSNMLFNRKYGFRSHYSVLGRKNPKDEDIIETMWFKDNTPLNMFNGKKMNYMYNYFKSSDVVVYVEYGLYMNTNARLASMKAIKVTQPQISGIEGSPSCHGMKNYHSVMYGFNVGFEFKASETYPDLSNSYFFSKFASETYSLTNDYGLVDMLTYAIYDIGGNELYRMPDSKSFTIRREGYSVFIHFVESENFLHLVFTAGRLPYVLQPEDLSKSTITLKDRDFDVSYEQNVLIMRRTESVLKSSKDEYEMRLFRTLNTRYKVPDDFADERMRSTEINVTNKMCTDEFVFDCTIGAHPLFDTYKYGFNNMLPTYGGFSLFYWLYFYFTFLTSELNLDIDQCFCTPTSLMNFVAGNLLPYDVMHGFYPMKNPDDGQTMTYLVNPPLKTFIRFLDILISRNRTLDKKIHDVRNDVGDVITLELQNSIPKLYINDNNYSYKNIQQVYNFTIENYPVVEMANGFFVSYTQPRKPIILEEPFSCVLNALSNNINNNVQFRFYGYDEKGNKYVLKFSKGDKVMIKGVFLIAD